MRSPSTILAALLTLALFIALLLLAPHMYPILHGNAPEFWETAAKIDIGGAPHGTSGVAVHHNDHWVYLVPGIDFPTCYAVDDAAVLHDLPKAEAELARQAGADPASRSVAGDGYSRWKGLPPPRNTDLNELIRQIEEAWALRTGHPSIVSFYHDELRAVLNRADRYWANILFEFIYLAALLWFTCWPFIRNRTAIIKYLHLSLVPLLFYLPLWLGYSAGSQGQGNLPDGGIVYSRLIRACGRPFVYTTFDREFLTKIPPILSPISQGSTLTNRVLSTMLYPLFGPTDVLLRTTALISVIAAIHFIIWLQRKRTRQRPGFPVALNESAPNR